MIVGTQALRLARRELRGGLRGFRVFIACLALGVAAIAGVQTVAGGILEGLEADGAAILGGDVAGMIRYAEVAPEVRAYIAETATVSTSRELRANARRVDTGDPLLVELKAVDGRYPLYGTVDLEGGLPLADALAQVDGVWGAALENSVLDRLELAVGDRLRVGDEEFEIRATIAHEPDRAGGTAIAFGPRLMIADAALDATGLVRPGAMIAHHYRMRLPEGADATAYREDLQDRFPDAGWRLRDLSDAAPQLRRTIERLAMFLTLVGLTALLVGGVGVGNAIKAYMDGKIATIGTLKTLGAPSAVIFQTYLAQVLALAAIGIALGLVIGGLAPVVLGGVIAELLPVTVELGIHPGALASAAGFGVLIALVFSIWPLARARDVPAAGLFRDLVAGDHARPPLRFAVAIVGLAAALAGLVIATAERPAFAAWFVGGALAAVALFRLAAWLVIAGARRAGRPRRPGLRLALANLCRPGAPTGDVVLSLGLGLTVLVAIALIESNMSRQVRETIPADAPDLFFVDIQPDQIEPFAALVAGWPGTGPLDRVPNLRGRIEQVNGMPAADAVVDPDHAWVLNGDRGVTYSATQRPEHTITAGAWWTEDYAGPPLVSVYADVADAFGIGVGDRLTVNVLGRPIEAEIASVRDIDWQNMRFNYTLVFSPEPLVHAPHTYLANVQVDEAEETGLTRAVAEAFPNIAVVRVRDALDTVNAILEQIGAAVRTIAAVTLAAGTLVLAGAVAAGHRRRVYDAVVLKVLGATRWTVLRAFLLEYGLLGALTAAIAAVLGTVAAWAVLTFVMDIEWTFPPAPVAAVAVLATLVTLLLGFAGTWHALGQKSAPLLRNE
ncbi:MAG: FtsX-like permease family protein [Rhodospirillaceae bacterium]|nr:FtsX-like permease family protein [Rhodospirillaceae bacterium]